ncbi:MAG: hypothetical protein JSU72_01395 [Deltaproteobacteria bacterium]|nr:MAG: hypothetical protein JSU72_01395 [Deltaproteobacteria bacterium]
MAISAYRKEMVSTVWENSEFVGQLNGIAICVASFPLIIIESPGALNIISSFHCSRMVAESKGVGAINGSKRLPFSPHYYTLDFSAIAPTFFTEKREQAALETTGDCHE